jgi:predicted hotdog family 3-hydroxylacyl-ACP dehydratase
MVGKLLDADERSACTEFVITADNIFVCNGLFIEAGIIENMAQTCAAGMGYLNANTVQDEVRIGFLSAIRNLIIKRLPKVGEILHTSVFIVEHFVGMLLIKTEVKIKEETIAEGEMKIFITGYV